MRSFTSIDSVLRCPTPQLGMQSQAELTQATPLNCTDGSPILLRSSSGGKPDGSTAVENRQEEADLFPAGGRYEPAVNDKGHHHRRSRARDHNRDNRRGPRK